jgi:hypothetical protein
MNHCEILSSDTIWHGRMPMSARCGVWPEHMAVGGTHSVVSNFGSLGYRLPGAVPLGQAAVEEREGSSIAGRRG